MKLRLRLRKFRATEIALLPLMNPVLCQNSALLK